MGEQLSQSFRRSSWERSMNTARGIDVGYENYPTMLGFENKEAFLKWISGKTVLDLGSGMGVIARDIKLEEEKTGQRYNAKVVSLNPSFAKKGFRERADEESESYLTFTGRLPPPNSEEHRELTQKINAAHNDLAVAGTWNNLPFADNSFDRIMATYSFPYYELGGKDKKLAEQKLLEVISEIKRVLRPGGEARFYPVFPPKLEPDSSPQGIKKFSEPYLLDLIRHDSTLECRVIISNQPDGRECLIMVKKEIAGK